MLQTLQIPDLGEEDTEGTVLSILVQNGSSVQKGDILLEVETDKVVLEIPAPSAGTIEELLVSDGDIVVFGSEYLKIRVADVPVSEPDSEKVDAHSVTQPTPLPDKAESDNQGADSPKHTPPARKMAELPQRSANTTIAPAGPAARRLARELGINIGVIAGSGRGGRISRDDVKGFAKNLISLATSNGSSGSASPVTKRTIPDPGRYGDIETVSLSRIDKTTAGNMSYSVSEIPHAWIETIIDITDVEAMRKDGKAQWQEGGHQVTLTAIICKVLAKAMRRFPKFNCIIDVENETLIYRQYVNIGVAVDTPRGLVVPCLKEADKKSVLATADELSRLSKATRDGKLTAADLKGAGMTLSNLGGLGVSGILPIVNWPEVAILGVAAGDMRPTYIADELLPRLMMPVTLGFDHRVINGADAARFLAFIKEVLEAIVMDFSALDTD